MAESSNPTQIPSPPNVIPKEEPVTLDRPESPNPFLPANHVEFNFDQITFTTNNEDSKIWVSSPTGGIRGKIGITTFRNALRAHYLPYSSMYVPPPSITIVRPRFATIGYSGEIRAKGILKKSFLPPRWRLLMAQIIQCLGGKIGGHDQTSNKDAIILYCLANGVGVDYAKLIWEDIIHKLNKKTREKVVPYPRFISLLLEYMMPEYDNEELTIQPTRMCLWLLKLPKTSSHSEKKVPQGKKPGAKGGLRRKQSSKHTSESQTEASKSKAGHLEDENMSRATSEEGSHPQLNSGMSIFINIKPVHSDSFTFHSESASGNDVSADSTTEVDPGKSTPNDSIPHQHGMDEGTKNYAHGHTFVGTNISVLVDQTKSARDGLKTAHTDLGTNEESRSDDISKKINLEDLSDLIKDTRSVFFTPDSPNDEPIIVTDESEEEEAEKHEAAHDASYNGLEDTSASHPPSPKLAQPQFPNVNKLAELLVTSLKPEISNVLASHDFASSIPSELKEPPSKITTLSGEIQELKRHVQCHTSPRRKSEA
ncbi:hypothetical protein Tco_0933543 [Tanacetum coccineum]